MKFKVGDRVRILRQEFSPGSGTTSAGYGKSVGKVGRVDDVDKRYYTVYAPSARDDDDYAGLFLESELELVNEGTTQGEKKMGRRTFKLRKDTPTMKRGALLQEQCDDGTQPYVMLNQDTHCLDPSYQVSISKRSIVEEQPQWFVEVFKVTPEYMTREELDQFEEFKRSGRVTKKTTLILKGVHRAPGKHLNGHAKPQKPGLYKIGNTRLSRERLMEAVNARNTYPSAADAARSLNVSMSTFYSYVSAAKKAGIL